MIKLQELLFLNSIKGFGKVKANKYLEAVRESDDLNLLFHKVLNEKRISEDILVSALAAARQKYNDLVAQKDLHVITVFDPEYPQGFQALETRKPLILYAKGDISILNKPGISVVGTRKPSPWTQKFGRNISKKMSLVSGRIIVSGLALGCDRYGHEGAILANVPTVAILPSGVNNIVPPVHKSLAKEIVEKGGCLISEYSPNATAFRMTFVERDSLIAAMTDITYVIECAENSGTMHTVDAAYKMGRNLACYYPDKKAIEKGAKEIDYLGNKIMIDKMGARVICKEDDLNDFFKMIATPKEYTDDKSGNDTHQISIEELIVEEH